MRALHRIGFCLTACVPHPILRPPYFNEPMLIVNQVMLDCTGFIMQATCCLKYTTCKVRILDFAKWVLDTIDFILACTMHTMHCKHTMFCSVGSHVLHLFPNWLAALVEARCQFGPELRPRKLMIRKTDPALSGIFSLSGEFVAKGK